MYHELRLSPDDPILQTPAIWHPSPDVPRQEWVSVLFRRDFSLAKAASIRCHISASQRYELWLDGRRVSRGPSRSDPLRWGVRKVALGKLSAGEHHLAVRVSHFGDDSGIGQMGGPAFFVLALQRGSDVILQTDDSWRCYHDRSSQPLRQRAWGGRGVYYVVGSGERIDPSQTPEGWSDARFDDSDWPVARKVTRHNADPWGNLHLGCKLRRDPLGEMEHRTDRFARVAEAPGDLRAEAVRLVAGDGSLTIPARRKVRLVLDRGELTNAYPVFTFSGGEKSTVRIVSAEAPYDPETFEKGDRDVTEGKAILGHLDEIRPSGRSHETVTTRWFRSFRYVELTIRTKSKPLVIEDIACEFTGLPMKMPGKVRIGGGGAKEAERFEEFSWRTARLCAHETFFDCPHYEQAQFPGDSRVQAIYQYLVCNDDTLARKAIDDFHASRLPDGLTQCRYPSRRLQLLPTFSLQWMGMLHDLLVYRGREEFLAEYLPAGREVLGWFLRRRREDGLLGRIEHAPFIDWTPDFAQGNAPQDSSGGSSLLTLLLAEACAWQGDLEEACDPGGGEPRRWRKLARGLRRVVMDRCWDRATRLLADTSSRETFSMHGQVQAVLSGAVKGPRAAALLRRALHDDTITQPGTMYYRYFVAKALRQAGLGERFFDLLPAWRRCLQGRGLTTWPESDRPTTRSDCHAWSVTVSLELRQTVLGIWPDPSAPACGKLRFSPALGDWPWARGTVCTPHGPVKVEVRRAKESPALEATINSPVAVELPDGRTLPAGSHEVTLRG